MLFLHIDVTLLAFLKVERVTFFIAKNKMIEIIACSQGTAFEDGL